MGYLMAYFCNDHAINLISLEQKWGAHVMMEMSRTCSSGFLQFGVGDYWQLP